jgi:hypothetical protein
MWRNLTAPRSDISLAEAGRNSVLVFLTGTPSRVGAVSREPVIYKPSVSSTLVDLDFGHLPALTSRERQQQAAAKFS